MTVMPSGNAPEDIHRGVQAHQAHAAAGGRGGGGGRMVQHRPIGCRALHA